MQINLRKSLKNEAQAVAFIHRKSKENAMPYLPDLHTPEEDLIFFRDTVFNECEIWVAEKEKILGFCAFKEGWINHLYILPEYQRQGIGKKFLMMAMEKNEQLELWTFQKNQTARNFYESNGFVAFKMTEGQENEEKEPDILYQWKRPIK